MFVGFVTNIRYGHTGSSLGREVYCFARSACALSLEYCWFGFVYYGSWFCKFLTFDNYELKSCTAIFARFIFVVNKRFSFVLKKLKLLVLVS